MVKLKKFDDIFHGGVQMNAAKKKLGLAGFFFNLRDSHIVSKYLTDGREVELIVCDHSGWRGVENKVVRCSKIR